MLQKLKNPENATTIAIVGKYIDLEDSYKSLNEALIHGGIANNARVHLKFVDSENITKENVVEILKDANGVLVPGGFGDRGIPGKLEAIRYAREQKKPYFGICLGMQLCVIEFARNVCGIKDADSTEFNKDTPGPIIFLLKEWFDYQKQTKQVRDEQFCYGATMRLGAFPCGLTSPSKAFEAYKMKKISERHRHRYEFNNTFLDELEKNGMRITGMCPDADLVEIVEIPDHPWFLGCQFHPEFKSRPHDPHPLFSAFIAAALKN
jgi:CTP synthase